MDGMTFSETIRGKELHFRLLTNVLLENDKHSLTVVGVGSGDGTGVTDGVLEKKLYPEYPPQSIFEKILAWLGGTHTTAKDAPDVFVVVEERNGRISADDVRYIEWLGKAKGARPGVLMLPEVGHRDVDTAHPRHLLDEKEEKELAGSFWKRQLRRLKALPAPITKDAAIAAVPRTLIPVAFIIFLAYIKRNDVLLARVGAYIGLTFGFSIGFSLLNQSVLNWITFWSEFTKDACEPYMRSLDRWLDRQEDSLHKRLDAQSSIRRPLLKAAMTCARWFMLLLGFVSARGDVFIGGPLLGVGCTYLARLALGPVGETVSVLTLHGFLLVLLNVLVGSIAGGPYTQVIAHLRAVGKISNRASVYLGIVETVKMELGRVADFGMQTLYNAIQATLAIVFWLLLLVVDRCYLKPAVHCLEKKDDIILARRMFKEFRARDDVKKALTAAL